MASPFRHLYEFGPYRLDASGRQLWRGAEAVHLTPKELDTLSALVRGAGRLMSKEELLKEIWPDTFVGEATLAQNVFTLRRALGEAEGGKSYIETAPRRGYRFAAPVREVREGVETEEAAPAPAAVGAEGRDPAGRSSEGRAFDSAAPASDPTSAADARGDARPGAERFELEGVASQSPAAQSPAADRNGAGGSLEETPRETPGLPVRAAVLITIVALAAVAGLVYFVYRFSVRPETETGRQGRAPSFQSMRVTRLPSTGAVS
ncbi:MAG TPA: transcriptional regulator, partial [Pyrinomonadaceae bacterium]|nr:transcriptional regulator [Pyrinomonadaceae bacterium]